MNLKELYISNPTLIFPSAKLIFLVVSIYFSINIPIGVDDLIFNYIEFKFFK